MRVLEERTIDTANEGVAWERGLESLVYVRQFSFFLFPTHILRRDADFRHAVIVPML